jgi:hypothetical protein
MRLLIVGAATPGSPRAARPELDPGADVQLILADDYPNFSICGIPSVANQTSPLCPRLRGPPRPPRSRRVYRRHPHTHPTTGPHDRSAHLSSQSQTPSVDLRLDAVWVEPADYVQFVRGTFNTPAGELDCPIGVMTSRPRHGRRLQSVSQKSLEMWARHDVVVRAFLAALQHVECGLRQGDPCQQPLAVAGHHLMADRCGPGSQHRPDVRESEARLLRDHDRRHPV